MKFFSATPFRWTVVAALALGTGLANPADGAVKLLNAALRQYGARVSVSAGPGARKDPQTEPDGTFDENVHSRQVMSGAPYTFTIELPFRLPVERLAFADSDYESELAPKDLEILLDDDLKLRYPLRVAQMNPAKPAGNT